MITVIDVIRQMHIEPTPNLTWSVGNAVRNKWEADNGELPTKVLRSKTSGHGSHCFAIYPDHWHDTIKQIVRMHETESARQLDLW